jgi:uncharacterized phiE125 gp8 family phage protein
MWALTQTVAPTWEAVDFNLLVKHCRLNTDDEYDLLSAYYLGARTQFEDLTGTQIALATYQYSFDSWMSPLWLPRPPFNSLVSVTYQDQNDTTQTLPPNDYILNSIDNPAYIRWLNPQPVYVYASPRIQVTYTAGYANSSLVPSDIKVGIMWLVDFWFRNRSAYTDMPLKDLPGGWTNLLNKYKCQRELNMPWSRRSELGDEWLSGGWWAYGR